MITSSENIATLSRRSRSQASAQGLRPSISSPGRPRRFLHPRTHPGRGIRSACSTSCADGLRLRVVGVHWAPSSRSSTTVSVSSICGVDRDMSSPALQRVEARGAVLGGSPSTGSSGGTTLTQSRLAFGQRVWKRQPDGGLTGRRHVAGQDDPLAAVGASRVGHRDGRQQRLGVGVPRLARRARSRRPISTILPRYITATRSLMCRTTDRSWAMNR